ncbi:MAG: hypothetical protein JW779_06165 [Candidatus Thorarchaeota archaeon]|nr:hypothetical protein [Candidatus Thorarchaeota archaeon]
MSHDAKPWYKNIWLQRIFYITCAILSLPAMSFAIQLTSDATGLSNFNYGVFILNEVTGPIVMLNFIFILFFIGLCMVFIFKAFSIQEDLPID